jgi:hypothetical protein
MTEDHPAADAPADEAVEAAARRYPPEHLEVPNAEQAEHDDADLEPGRRPDAVPEPDRDRHVAELTGQRGHGGERDEQHASEADGRLFQLADVGTLRDVEHLRPAPGGRGGSTVPECGTSAVFDVHPCPPVWLDLRRDPLCPVGLRREP